MGPPLRGIWDVIPFNRHRRLSERGSPRTATPTAFIGGNPSPATWGRCGRRPVRHNLGWSDFPEPLCHPTFAAPLPPSYEEGALRRERVRFIETVPVPQRCTGEHMGLPLRGMREVIPFNRHWWLSKRGSPGTATPTAFIGGNPSPATWGRCGQRPVRHNLGWCGLLEPLCHPTLASPLPPLLRGGGSVSEAGANFRNRCDNTPCRGRHISALRAAATRRLRS